MYRHSTSSFFGPLISFKFGKNIRDIIMISVNEYFGGNVKSLGYATVNGKSTVGVINEGEYEFRTESAETMTVIQGKMEVKIQGE
jgi:hypothetical protein